MHFETDIGSSGVAMLVVALVLAVGFELVNGFHDTANAVATVIYTRSLRPWVAVIWSGIWNFLGVAVGGVAVAMSIVKLLPPGTASAGGLPMVLALLSAAILWNLGTWWLGLPASSSHTLVGAIVGVGLARSLLPGHHFGEGVALRHLLDVGLSLLISPVIGFIGTAILVVVARRFLRSPRLHQPAHRTKPPPRWMRALLVSTCTGVSFAHGSNDGQKGIGLVMVILIALLPADFAIDRRVHDQVDVATKIEQTLAALPASAEVQRARADVAKVRETFESPPADKAAARTIILAADASLAKVDADLGSMRAELRRSTDYAPTFVLVLVACALGIGTMIGWRRIVITVGERIGKTHLSYAQGAAAELVAMTTIGLSAAAGLPVSTTHVLSSGVAGSMVAQHAGLQKATVRSIALAWILTLPAAAVLAAVLFFGFHALLS